VRKKRLVSLVKGENRKENLKKALILIKVDLSSFKKAKSVLIKPNLTSAYNRVADTSPQALTAILEFFQVFDPNFSRKKIIVAESSGEAYQKGESMERVYRRLGFDKVFEKYANLIVGDFNKSKKFRRIPIKTLAGERKIRVAQEVFDFDYKISLTVPKTHDTVGVTLGIKNFLMGIIKQEDKGLMHGLSGIHSDFQRLKASGRLLQKAANLIISRGPWQLNWLLNNYSSSNLKDQITNFNAEIFKRSVACLHENLFRLGKEIMPDLVIIDGFWGMDKDGPVYGRKRKLGVAIASVDPVKADGVGARVMGFEPEKIVYLRLLVQSGLGDLSMKGLIGGEIERLKVEFKPHRHFFLQQQVKVNP